MTVDFMEETVGRQEFVPQNFEARGMEAFLVKIKIVSSKQQANVLLLIIAIVFFLATVSVIAFNYFSANRTNVNREPPDYGEILRKIRTQNNAL